MATTTTTVRPVESAARPVAISEARWDNPAYQAFWLLRLGFTAAPILTLPCVTSG